MSQRPAENKKNNSVLGSKPETWEKAWMASPGPIKFSEHAILFLKGVFMGTADIVPGVSGGTVAFITGIYYALLSAISSLNWRTFSQALRFRGKDALSEMHLRFLVTLASGIVLAVVSTAHLMHYLLTEHAILTWSLFFGLIIASIIVVGQSIKNRIHNFPTLLIGTIIAYRITDLIPLHTPEKPWFIFFCGIVAICAMILPGLSGSFILLVLGKYAFITAALRNPFMPDNTQIILIFLSGCLVGILIFSRILHYGLTRWRDFTIAFLTGLMIGAIHKVWPWKITLESQIIRGKEYVIREENVWPLMDFDLVNPLLLMTAGFVLVLLLEKLSVKKSVN